MSTQPQIYFTTNKILRKFLKAQKIEPDTYGPAYDGESVGLDLYNAGLDIDIPPCFSFTKPPGTPASDKTPAFETHQVFKVLVPTGIRVSIPSGYVGLIQERGSVTKTSLKVRAGVIDPGYTGEVFVNCINTGCRATQLRSGQKLPFQLVVVRATNSYRHLTNKQYTEHVADLSRQSARIGSSD